MNIYDNEEVKILNQRRAKKILFVLGLLFLILGMRLWYLQILKGNEFRIFSDSNTIKEKKVLAPRGNILDRNGKILVSSRPGYRLSLDPAIFRRKDRKT